MPLPTTGVSNTPSDPSGVVMSTPTMDAMPSPMTFLLTMPPVMHWVQSATMARWFMSPS